MKHRMKHRKRLEVCVRVCWFAMSGLSVLRLMKRGEESEKEREVNNRGATKSNST